jgi:hypothetical protein
MKTKNRILLIGLVVSAFAVGLAAQVAQTPISSAHLAWKQQPPLLKIKSGGEVIAELRLLKPARLNVSGGVEASQPGTLRTAMGGIEIAPEGLSPWRISGAGIEVEISEQRVDKK